MSILSIYAHIEWALQRKAVVCILAATPRVAFARSEARVQLPAIIPVSEFLKSPIQKWH